MSIDLLEQRLEHLSFETPDAGRVTARVLSHAAGRRGRWPRAAALGVANIALLLLVGYFVPSADAVFADAPIAGDLLRDAGLVGAANRVTAVGAVSTSSGFRVELVGAYADSTRTVLLLHASPAIVFGGAGPELTDQFGRSYHLESAVSNGLTGDIAATYESLGWPDAITGARITLRMTSVEPIPCVTPPSGDPAQTICKPVQPVAGTWTLRATLGMDEGSALALPAPVQLGPATYRFTSVRSSSATIEVDLTVTGVTAADLQRRIPDQGKGTAVFDIALLGPAGDVVTNLYELGENDQGVRIRIVGNRFTPGDYRLRVSYLGSGEFERVLHVP
jgi:hypothetical protein